MITTAVIVDIIIGQLGNTTYMEIHIYSQTCVL